MDDTVVKRLHVSGLTPALTSDDLSRRLSTFGTVKAVEGFGLHDGLGQPRKFGYVTLETTQGKLARSAEREAAANEPPKKKRRRCAGKEAADMSLVTPENVVGRGGWKVTPLGRIVKPVRMRPEHPLPPPNEDKEKARLKGKNKDGELKKKRKRAKDPDTRARRRTIDVTRYGSVHLKGMFLDMEVLGTKVDGDQGRVREVEMESESSESEEEEAEVAEEVSTDEVKEVVKMVVEEEIVPPKTAPQPIKEVVPEFPTSLPPPAALSSLPDDNTDIATEKKLTLNLLASLFGDKDEADWVGRESVGSDVDEAEIAKRHRMIVDGADDGDFEVVPMDGGAGISANKEPTDDEEDVDDPMEVEGKAEAPVQKPQTEKQQQATKLKDLFAPREEDAGFSLLGHLDLDLELDDEVPFATTEVAPSTSHEPLAPHFTAPSSTIATHTYTAPQLNAKQPLFFPFPASGDNMKARPKDIFDVAMENKWHWRDLAVEFYRTGTEEDIRKRWEDSKVELTKEWKRRCREAGKVNRRRRGGDTGDA
ncbi:hypothetical protein H0H87_003388 [Tephrocybe sp. NHM501043]|nr:hypothetical protein H0H87_003388 [Tephrocybe sp. NHM501043]